MSEETMERVVQQALVRDGIADEVIAAGQFSPAARPARSSPAAWWAAAWAKSVAR